MRCPICNTLAGEFRDKNGVTYTCNRKGCPWTGERITFPKKEEPKWNWGNDEKKDQTTETDIFGNPKKKKDDKKKKNDPPWKFW